MKDEKMKFAQTHIDGLDIFISHIKKDIESERVSLDRNIANEDYFWLEASANKIAELAREIRKKQEIKSAMQSLLDYLKMEESE